MEEQYIINFSTTHNYDFAKTFAKFIEICTKHRDKTLSAVHDDQAWIISLYQNNYEKLIKPYNLGQFSTEAFLDALESLFKFKDEVEGKRDMLRAAWNSSIHLSNARKDRLSQVRELAKISKVYLVSDTNKLNIDAIFALYPEIDKESIKDKIAIAEDKNPVEIFPNVFFCLSYRTAENKWETIKRLFSEERRPTVKYVGYSEMDPLVAKLGTALPEPQKAQELGMQFVDEKEFFQSLALEEQSESTFVSC